LERFAPDHHGYQRACDLISGQASNGPFGSPVAVIQNMDGSVHSVLGASDFEAGALGAGGISHSFWDQAAAASGISVSTASPSISGIEPGTAGHQSVSPAGIAYDQFSQVGNHLGVDQYDHGACADSAQPAQSIDAGAPHVQIDVASHVSDFSHQIHI
jgi:hypothetical protein